MDGRRYLGVDRARVLATAAIVWIHCADSKTGKAIIPALRFAVPLFTVAMVFFAFSEGSKKDLNFWRYSLMRIERLYVPFLIWSGVYLVLRSIKHLFVTGASPILFGPAMLLNGTAEHLWFLPFAVGVSILAFLFGRLSKTLSFSGGILLGSLFFTSAIAVSLIPSPIPMDAFGNPISYFVGLSWDALPAALLSIPAIILLSGRNVRSFLVVPAFITFFILEVTIVRFGTHPLTSAFAGLALFMGALHQPVNMISDFLSLLSRFTFGIYISHVALVEFVQVLSTRFGIGFSIASDAAIWAISFLGSLWLCMAISRVPIIGKAIPK